MRRIITLWLLLFVSMSLCAENLDSVFPSLDKNQKGILLKGEYLQSSSKKAELPKYVPRHELASALLEYQQSKNPELFLEMVTFIPGENYSNEKKLLSALNTLAEVSDQEGLEYLSFNRGNKMYPLITRSYYIEKKGSNKIIDDPRFSTLGDTYQFSVFQKDTTFGANRYSYEYTSAGNGFRLIIRNEGRLSVKGVFKVAEPEEVMISVLCIPVDQGLICYSLAFIQSPPTVKEVLGYKVNVIGSYTKRLKVITEWYRSKLLLL